GTRAFFGSIRPIQNQTNPFSFPLVKHGEGESLERLHHSWKAQCGLPDIVLGCHVSYLLRRALMMLGREPVYNSFGASGATGSAERVQPTDLQSESLIVSLCAA